MANLTEKLLALAGKGYGGYKSLSGAYQFAAYILVFDHIQVDPFAPATTLHLVLPLKKTGLPKQLLATKNRRIAVADFLQRAVAQAIIKSDVPQRGTGHSSEIRIDHCGQEILERTAIIFTKETLEVRLTVGLPANGRRINAKAAAKILLEILPQIVQKSLMYDQLDQRKLQAQVELFEMQQELRQQMQAQGLVAFVANGAVLPRDSGDSDLPLKTGVPFVSPASLAVTFKLSGGKQVTGMGIGQGITLIVGGGYHGKSTLLQALDRGVYNHIQGDGRELVLTDQTAMKIRAEDGRSVANVNITPFINHIPGRRNTAEFSTLNASGSTSQAANVIEALESGAKTLLLDEDTSATNFMIRDTRMQRLVSDDREPITPFVAKVQALAKQVGVSTILVTGGSGAYFEVADRVIMMNEYQPGDVTKRAHEIAALEGPTSLTAAETDFGQLEARIPKKSNFRVVTRKDRFKARSRTEISFGHSNLNLSAVEQLVEPSQTRGITALLAVLKRDYFDEQTTVAEMLHSLYDKIDQQGLDQVLGDKRHAGDLAVPRPQELGAALNRYRGLRMIQRK
ncbi:ATPase [Ligilactobacillus pabuli]|uniref:ATPase n=1 Tax=Ligilactobacillus pabuli TaxID=2886039 RepID=A0ABQ5JM13_9LACO|nr:ABC-ATPase domain-containing protein [Ligilactobacillus pabuli]GKS82064.1 ATPase [Ligilactobacillus pabuli]